LEQRWKVDVVPPQEIAHLSSDREAIPVSSLQHTGLEQLLIAIDAALVIDPLVESSFRLPQSEGSILASLEGGAIIRREALQRFITETAVPVKKGCWSAGSEKDDTQRKVTAVPRRIRAPCGTYP
jgi:50S ribosomal subunit-associated GTPase HflX